MILFAILTLIAIILTAITVFAVSIGGSIAVVLFGDVIVCIALIIWVIARMSKRGR